MPKFFEGLVDKLVVPGARDALAGFGIRKLRDGYASYFVKSSVGRQQRRKMLGKVVRGSLKQMRLMTSDMRSSPSRQRVTAE